MTRKSAEVPRKKKYIKYKRINVQFYIQSSCFVIVCIAVAWSTVYQYQVVQYISDANITDSKRSILLWLLHCVLSWWSALN
jgi:hypothetical protein